MNKSVIVPAFLGAQAAWETRRAVGTSLHSVEDPRAGRSSAAAWHGPPPRRRELPTHTALSRRPCTPARLALHVLQL